MQKISIDKIKTFSIGFSDKNYDESYFASKIASHLNTDHIKLEATLEMLLILLKKCLLFTVNLWQTHLKYPQLYCV